MSGTSLLNRTILVCSAIILTYMGGMRTFDFVHKGWVFSSNAERPFICMMSFATIILGGVLIYQYRPGRTYVKFSFACAR